MKMSKLSEWMLAHRKMVVSFLGISFVLLLVLRIFVFPTLDTDGEVDWHSLIGTTLDGLISTIIVSFVVAITFWWIKSPLDRIPPGFEIVPTAISNTLESAARKSAEWEYIGHTGRYVRNRIFPILDNSSRRNNRPVHLRMMILDPRNLDLCERYANYRNQSRSSEILADNWTPETVRIELLTTIAKTALLNAETNQVQCEIRFRHVLSQFRVDASDDWIVVTQEDPQEPAFSYPKGSKFFDYYRRENRLVWDQSPPFDLAAITPNQVSDRVDLKNNLIAFIGGEANETGLVEASISLLDDDRSPYA